MVFYSLLKWLFYTPPRRCLLPSYDGTASLFTCNTPEHGSARIKLCCYDAQTNNHYCCPVQEPQDISYTTAITGSISAAVILLICIILICIFSSKCPLKKAYLYHRSRRAVERMKAAEKTPGV